MDKFQSKSQFSESTTKVGSQLTMAGGDESASGNRNSGLDV
jgi:hypothetical protein